MYGAHAGVRGSRKIDLTPREFSLLEYLLRNADRVVTRSAIAEHVWDYNFDMFTNVIDVYGLIAWLKKRGGGYQEALEDATLIRVAVNQEITTFDTQIRRGDEVALFPPMTGG